MADDAGALLVRSGLVPSSALDEARVAIAAQGGTIGEQLVAAGVIADDELTDFYRSRLLVPQVNPNTLARLPVRVVAAIPSDMAIELRAIPVALDGENNLTVAMGDPSNRHAVDEIAFFTGSYVVRAVATQMQIAWCLAHYYGHVSALGQRLLQPSGEIATPPASNASSSSSDLARAGAPRAKGLTGQVKAMRHRAMVPVTAAAAAADDKPEPRPASEGEAPKPARARSVSGEIRVPVKRAPSIRPPIRDIADDDSGPVISIEVTTTAEEATGPRKVAVARRRVKSDPPELAARAGEVDMATGPVRRVELDEPRIIIAEDDLGADVTGEVDVVAHANATSAPATTIEVSEDDGAGVVIHEHYSRESEPVVLDRRRPTDRPTDVYAAALPREGGGAEPDHEVLLLDAPKPRYHRTEKRTQVGIGALPALTRTQRPAEPGGIPTELDDAPTSSRRRAAPEAEATRVDSQTAPSSPDDDSDETLAAPPTLNDETNPNLAPPPPGAMPAMPAMRAPARPGNRAVMAAPRATTADEDEGRHTSVMSEVELDDAIPERTAEVVPAHLESQRRSRYDSVDDGWGPPGTTIPPALLGAMPGSEDDSTLRIPMPDLMLAPLIVAPPTPPEPTRGAPNLLIDGSWPTLSRALEHATSRSIALIQALEHAPTRDEVLALMGAHLAETHQVSGFFSIKAGELALFSMKPHPEVISVTTLKLDHPSTLQDVVGTRLPYRGPMHDDESRNFLASALGACPAEILLVPIAVRERVVGVLFGERRTQHTFDDQLALAARAAGMALERILMAKRS